MRKITAQAVNAFYQGKSYFGGNTKVEIEDGVIYLSLFGNNIAKRNLTTGQVEITNSGWKSVTTKERLNELIGVEIYQRKGEWYLNGELWDGNWQVIK